MPQRFEPLITGEIYHIINRGVASMPIYINDSYYQHFLETLLYYQNQKTPLRYSYFSRLPKGLRKEALSKLNQNKVKLKIFFLLKIPPKLLPAKII